MSEILVSTVNYNAIMKLCKDAHENSKMVSVIGYPGAGKTTALLNYRGKKQDIHYVRITASMNARQFYSQILTSMGVEGYSKGATLHDLINHVCLRLNYDQTRQLLIIDEAGKFKPKFLEYLHELRDNTAGLTGIILAGPEYFHENLKAWTSRGVVGVPEFYRRIQHWEYLNLPSKAEVKAICNARGVHEEEVISDISINCKNFAEIAYAIDTYLKLRDKLNK
jgi:hypothetical protein